MKSMKKLLALALVLVMLTALSVTASAASITINQDDTYAGTEGEAGRTYTWYKVFSVASKEDGYTNDFAGGYEDDGTAVTEQGDGMVSYTATAAVAAKLGTWDTDTKTWTKASGNEWFDLAPIAGSNPAVYSVTWVGANSEASTVQAAASWLVDNSVFESGKTGTMTFSSGTWTSGTIDDGYYVVKGDTGNNLVAVTTDVTIDEKNDYPPIVKEEEDEDSITIVDTATGEALNVAIGDSIDYTVTVTIPAAAKVGETIEVWDKPSSGLTYNGGLVVTPATDVTDGTIGTGEIWHKIITVTAANKGTDIVFAYSMTINDDALVDLDRMNEATLKYGNNYESLPHSVKYTTYFGGIIKTNSDAEPLEGVKFDLFEGGEAFPVKLVEGVYLPDPEGDSNEVVTDADGLIRIRGLDDDKEYTLTETETLPGYNMLTSDVTLTLTEDEGTAFADATTAQEFDSVVNNAGTELPSTGGIGTTLFYVIGSILFLGAVVVLVTKRRVHE